MRKKTLISGLLCLLIFFHVSVPTYALDIDDEDFRTAEPLTYDAYSFADLAAARLAGYGFLPEYYKTPQKETTAPITRADGVWLLYTAYGYETGKPCPFSDVPEEYQEAVTWAYEEGLVSGIGNGLFGMGKMTGDSFKMILQRLLGDEYDLLDPYPMGSRSMGFSLGDAALLLEEALLYCSKQNNIPEKIEQIPYPFRIQISLQSLDDLEPMLKKAFDYLPQYIVFTRGEEISEENFFDTYLHYRTMQYSIASGNDIKESWIYPYTYGNFAIRVDYKISADAYALKSFDEDPEVKRLADQFWDDEISSDDYTFQYDIKKAEALGNHRMITFKMCYAQSWELIRDADDVFAVYADSTYSSLAEVFYAEVRSKLEGLSDYEKVITAKKIINAKARYGSVSNPRAYELPEFFLSGRVVCGVYADAFQYIMLREGIPSVIIIGATTGNRGAVDHAWNKVKVDGKWYNIDLCWADTENTTKYDLKSDQSFTANSHWAEVYQGGEMAAAESYSKSLW